MASAAPEQPSAEALDLAERTMGRGKFSLTWSDVERDYTMLGPETPLMPVLGWRDDKLDRLLRASSWSWAAVNGNSRAISQIIPVIQERIGGNWVRATDEHPMWKFLRHPLGISPGVPRFGWRKLSAMAALHYYTAGNAFWLPADTAEQVIVTPLLTPQLMQADEAAITKFPTLYKMRFEGGKELTWQPDQVVNIMAPGADSFWRGASPMQAAMTPVEIDHVATERQRYSLRNQAAPGLTVMSDRPWGNTPAQRQAIEAELLDGYVDMRDHGKPWVIGGGGAKIEKGFSPEELQVFSTKDSSAREIMAVIGIQPSVLGQLDKATYSNTKEATILWWQGSIQPVLEIMLEDINMQLVQPRHPDARIHYTLAGSHIGLQLLSAQAEVGAALSRLGLSTADIGVLLQMELPDREYLKVPVSSWITAGRIEPERIAEIIEELQAVAEGETND